ncbi:M23 family metallopeptidase [Speluncibacter jeojiensis]|uniref:M23 family metallopeptidase n=1 Tax=Speluncibacter jeojiensis TaxID=2710754 RepID=A0A9X4M115_9ACTN|nr:M23 family metallopeptidase [Corynebacteriales bacterium D3-21]
MAHDRTSFTQSRFVGASRPTSRHAPDAGATDTFDTTMDRDDDRTRRIPVYRNTTPSHSRHGAHETSDAQSRRWFTPVPADAPTEVFAASTPASRAVEPELPVLDAAASFAPTAAPDTSATPQSRRRGAHRVPTPPHAIKGRVAVVAVAAGAVVAAGQSMVRGAGPSVSDSSDVALASGSGLQALGGSSSHEPAGDAQVLTVAQGDDLATFSEQLAKGTKYAADRAARDAASRRPLFALPAQGIFTSVFGTRWGTIHGGVDIAAAMDTPIHAVADGTVIDSGPASGFGMWVRLRHDDGTVSVYGHIDRSLVQVGQHVLAGDEIAEVGNRGFSTGPHLHFEIWLDGSQRVDPLPWLAQRGISLGHYAG